MTDQAILVRDLMVDVFDFPHIPYWFTLRQVAGILKKTISGSKCIRPLAVLVFDEKYNLVGHLDVDTLIRGMGRTLFTDNDAPNLADNSRTGPMSELSERPASTLLMKTAFYVDPEDPWTKAAEVMLRNDLQLLPVLENSKKLVGIVRSVEIFEQLSARYFRA
jgi:CBS domain-containing protein